jgi:two-component system, cell cycle sensor histidine kinase and response regulator CckA
MTRPLRVLILEDCEDDAELLLRELKRQNYEPDYIRVDTAKGMNDALDRETWSLIISDYSMPQFTAMQALDVLKRRNLDLPFVIVSGTIGEETAAIAMKSGAHDFLTKGKLNRLGAAVERELRDAEDRRQHKKAEEALRKSEEQLRQSQKVEAIGRLAGGIAHDFNNLLTIINGYTELLLARLPPQDRTSRDINEIRKAGMRAASLTRQLLAFSRKQILEPKVLDMNAIVVELEKMLRRLIGEDVRLTIVQAQGLRRIKADPGQIEQVIMNLVVNARDAMPQGGNLTLETANVDLDEAYAARHVGVRSGAYILLAVSDTGSGIDKESMSHIFEPFYTTKGPGKGTGLGLSTVYGIVKQSGGNVWAYSEPGRGTTFKIYLPQAEGTVDRQSRDGQRAGIARGSETLLLVEDQKELRELVREMLEMNGYTVVEAGDGLEALEICQRHEGRIDLMLSDVVMPQMGGRELAQRLATIRPEMKVLYMSGYTSNAIVHHGILDPGTALLQKPFTPDSLARKVREVLDGDEQTRAEAGPALRSQRG